ncbi:hypothetical protein RHDE110596_23905 [Prescottella defluvii]
MPPNLMPDSGMIRRIRPRTIGIVTLSGWRITQRVSRPQMLASISSVDLIWPNRLRPNLSIRRPRMPRIAGRTVTEVKAASTTVAIAP